MTLSQVQIRMSPPGDPRGSRVVVDGRDITKQIHALNLRAEVGKVDELTLTLSVLPAIDRTGPARLVLDPATADLLIRHGWTPPVEADRTVLLPATAAKES